MHTHIVPQFYINNDDDGDGHKIKLGYYTSFINFNGNEKEISDLGQGFCPN